jgi:hypothetical protein
MGYSYFQESGPLMCFNAAKLWQLGWNNNRHFVVSSSQPSYVGEIAAFVDDPDIDGPPMLIKLDTPTTEDYFINFNLRQSFNSGTREGGDEVLVVLAGDGNNYSDLNSRRNWEREAHIKSQTLPTARNCRWKFFPSTPKEESQMFVFALVIALPTVHLMLSAMTPIHVQKTFAWVGLALIIELQVTRVIFALVKVSWMSL